MTLNLSPVEQNEEGVYSHTILDIQAELPILSLVLPPAVLPIVVPLVLSVVRPMVSQCG